MNSVMRPQCQATLVCLRWHLDVMFTQKQLWLDIWAICMENLTIISSSAPILNVFRESCTWTIFTLKTSTQSNDTPFLSRCTSGAYLGFDVGGCCVSSAQVSLVPRPHPLRGKGSGGHWSTFLVMHTNITSSYTHDHQLYYQRQRLINGLQTPKLARNRLLP